MTLGKKVENPRPVCLADVKAILGERGAQPDFGYEQQMSLDYSKRFCRLKPEDAHALAKALAEFEPLKPEGITKIVDLLPEFASTLCALLLKDKVTLSADQTAKVLALVAKFREKMIEPEVVAPAPKPEEPAGEPSPDSGA